MRGILFALLLAGVGGLTLFGASRVQDTEWTAQRIFLIPAVVVGAVVTFLFTALGAIAWSDCAGIDVCDGPAIGVGIAATIGGTVWSAATIVAGFGLAGRPKAPERALPMAVKTGIVYVAYAVYTRLFG